MISSNLTISCREGWRFPDDAANPKHGPTLDKPQTKVWFAGDRWWALLVRPEGAGPTELAIFSFDRIGEQWIDSGVVVTDTPESTADATFDGEDLWVVTRSVTPGLTLRRFRFTPGAHTWSSEEKAYELPDVVTPSVSVARGGDGSIWIAYASGGVPRFVRGKTEDFPALSAPTVVPGATATLIDVDLTALTPVGEEMGLLWSDQGTEAYYFAIASPDGSWRTEVAAQGDSVADDHIAIRATNGRLYVAAKTSIDTDPDHTDDDALIILLVREADGAWHHHPVVAVRYPVTRPIPLLDPESEMVHVLYTFGAAGEERTINMKSATFADLDFGPGPGEPAIAVPDGYFNDPTGSREPLTRDRGALVLTSDCLTRRYAWSYLTLR